MGYERIGFAGLADGASAVRVEVTPIAGRELTVHVDGETLRMPFERFPWFRAAGADPLSRVEWHAPDHLLWPRLGIKLSIHYIRRVAGASRPAR